MCGPALLMLIVTVVSLVLLYVAYRTEFALARLIGPSRRVLVIFSTPFIHQFYFLRSEAAGGIRFGVVGFCLELTGICTKQIGYNLDGILIKPLPMLLILYPIAAGITLLGVITLLPILFSHHRHPPRWPYIAFALVSTVAFLVSAAALAVSVYLFTKLKDHFHSQHIEAAYGPSIWIAVAATAVLLVIALNAGCGTCAGGRFGRQARHHVYTY